MLRLDEMPWLLRAPHDYVARVKQLDSPGVALGETLSELAKFYLPPARLDRLGKRLAAYQAGDAPPLAPLEKISLGLVTNATSEFMADALRATALRYGIDLRLHVADFDQAVQEALNPQSTINSAKPDLVLLALDHRGLPFGSEVGTPGAPAAQSALDYVELLRRSFAENARSTIILQTVARPGSSLFGSFDRRIEGTAIESISEFNRRLPRLLDGSGDLLLDTASLAEQVGLQNWHDAVRWHAAKLPFSMDCMPLWADHVCRLIAAWRGRSRKVLVLDLDNTLWGGVIGDDGLDGIKLGQGDATGEAHLTLQRLAKALHQRGVVLAICSKNDVANARLPFEQHPDMILKLDDFAAFVANWTDKASNLKAIAQALNLGLDSLVFVDDNPVERDQVRTALPMVAVPELPADPSHYAPLIMSGGYFEAVAFSDDDRRRAEQYQQNLAREQIKVQAGSIDDYLKSLDMAIEMKPFDNLGRERITQLINKTNQFNLTTLRCDEKDVIGWQHSAQHVTLQTRLVDKFGDNGMISVVIAEKTSPRSWTLIQWLMSCRVLNRRAEEAVLNQLVQLAMASGAQEIVGVYKPTAKNAMVKEHYRKLGFSLVSENPAGETTWKLDVTTFIPRDVPLRVVVHDRAIAAE